MSSDSQSLAERTKQLVANVPTDKVLYASVGVGAFVGLILVAKRRTHKEYLLTRTFNAPITKVYGWLKEPKTYLLSNRKSYSCEETNRTENKIEYLLHDNVFKYDIKTPCVRTFQEKPYKFWDEFPIMGCNMKVLWELEEATSTQTNASVRAFVDGPWLPAKIISMGSGEISKKLDRLVEYFAKQGN